MLNEHAITYTEKISVKDLDYIVRKANRLGRNGREVVRVYQQEDAEGCHVYFEVTGMPCEKKGED
jgi:hypothetical protein